MPIHFNDGKITSTTYKISSPLSINTGSVEAKKDLNINCALSINAGSINAGNVKPVFAYSMLRSSYLPIDALFLAVQGFALGFLLKNPKLGATAGVILSITDRVYAPIIDSYLPGRCVNKYGIPLGLKNFSLALASLATAIFASKTAFSYLPRSATNFAA